MPNTAGSISIGGDFSQFNRDANIALRQTQDLFSKNFLRGSAFTRPLGQITGATDEFSKSMAAANARVIAFGASAGLIFQVSQGVKELVNSTIEVNKALTELNVLFNKSSEELEGFGRSIFEIAKQTGQSFSEIAIGATELARQGLGAEETLVRLKDAAILARQSGLGLEDSVNALTASINSFSEAGLTSTEIINKFANVDASFAVSSKDLAEALKRVGSTAQDAGVSIDQLIGLVTSAQQTTSRGGAVIGNALKTIFTRIERPQVLTQLEQLGITVRDDVSGALLSTSEILKNFAVAFDGASESQQSYLAELVGSVYQINILKALLGDLSKNYGIAAQATEKSASAQDEAIKRNDEYNKSLSAILNKTRETFRQIGSEVGNVTIAPLVERVGGLAESLLQSTDGDVVGEKLAEVAKGFLKGIGNFISGPGLLLIGGGIIKLTKSFAEFAAQASADFLGLNKFTKQQADLQIRLNEILSTQPGLQDAILKKSLSQVEIDKILLNLARQRLETEKILASTIANSSTTLLRTNQLGYSKKTGKLEAPTAASGFIPTQQPTLERSEIEGAIKGGYEPGEVRRMNIPGVGGIVYNSNEKIKDFGFEQPAILPPHNSKAGQEYKKNFKEIHGFDPYLETPNFAMDKRYYALGLVPKDNTPMTKDPTNSTLMLNSLGKAFAFTQDDARELNVEKTDVKKKDKKILKLSGPEKIPTLYTTFKEAEEEMEEFAEAAANGDKRKQRRIIRNAAKLVKKNLKKQGYDGIEFPVTNGESTSRAFIDTNKTAATGFIPNYARKFIGEGAYARFFDLGYSIDKLPVGIKEFKRAYPADVEREFLISKYLESLSNKVPGLEFPRVFGSVKDSISQGGILKQVIKDPTADKFASSLNPYSQSSFKLLSSDFLRRAIKDFELNYGIKPEDLNLSNFTLNKPLQDELLGLHYNENAKRILSEEGFLSERTGKVFDYIVKKGGRANIIDPGEFIIGKNKLKDLKNLYGARGIIPNYALTDLFKNVSGLNNTTLSLIRKPYPLEKPVLTPFELLSNLNTNKYIDKLSKFTQGKNIENKPELFLERNFEGFSESLKNSNALQSTNLNSIFLNYDNLVSRSAAGVSEEDIEKLKEITSKKSSRSLIHEYGHFLDDRLGITRNIPENIFKSTRNQLGGRNFNELTGVSVKLKGTKYKAPDNVEVESNYSESVAELFANSFVYPDRTFAVDKGLFSRSRIINLKDIDLYKYLKEEKGFIPSFNAKLGYGALYDAVQREKAAGIPESIIKIGADDRLKSPRNPKGLGVFNTKDEPRGLSQGIARAVSVGLDPKTHGVKTLFGGLIPNYAPPFVSNPESFQPFTPIEKRDELGQSIDSLKRKIKLGELAFEEIPKIVKDLSQSFNLTIKGSNYLQSSLSQTAKIFGFSQKRNPDLSLGTGAYSQLEYSITPPKKQLEFNQIISDVARENRQLGDASVVEAFIAETPGDKARKQKEYNKSANDLLNKPIVNRLEEQTISNQKFKDKTLIESLTIETPGEISRKQREYNEKINDILNKPIVNRFEEQTISNQKFKDKTLEESLIIETPGELSRKQREYNEKINDELNPNIPIVTPEERKLRSSKLLQNENSESFFLKEQFSFKNQNINNLGGATAINKIIEDYSQKIISGGVDASGKALDEFRKNIENNVKALGGSATDFAEVNRIVNDIVPLSKKLKDEYAKNAATQELNRLTAEKERAVLNQQTKAASSFRSFFVPQARRDAEALRRTNPELYENARANLRERISRAGITASIGIPIVAGVASQFVGDETIAQRGTKSLITGAGNIASYAALGSIFGPQGIAAGAALGGILEIPNVIKGFTDNIPDLIKNLELASSKLNRTSQELNSYISLEDKLANVRNLSASQVKKLNEQRNEIISNLSPDIKNQLNSTSSLGGIKEVVETILKTQQFEVKSKEFATQFGGVNVSSAIDSREGPIRLNFLPERERAKAEKFFIPPDLVKEAVAQRETARQLGPEGENFASAKFGNIQLGSSEVRSIANNSNELVFSKTLLESAKNFSSFLNSIPFANNKTFSSRDDRDLSQLYNLIKEESQKTTAPENLLQILQTQINKSSLNKESKDTIQETLETVFKNRPLEAVAFTQRFAEKNLSPAALSENKELREKSEDRVVKGIIAVSDFASTLFKAREALNNFTVTLENTNKSILQNLEFQRNRNEIRSQGFIERQSNFSGPQTLLSLRSEAERQNIISQRTIDISRVNQNFGTQINSIINESSLKDLQDKINKILPDTSSDREIQSSKDIVNKTIRENAPLSEFNQRIQTALSKGDIEGVNSELNKFGEYLSEQNSKIIPRINEFSTSPEAANTKEIIETIAGSIRTAILQREQSISLIDQSSSQAEFLSALKRIEESRALDIQKQLSIGGGPRNILTNPTSFKTSIETGELLVRQSRGIPSIQGQGRFEIAETLQSLGVDIQQSAKPLFDSLVTDLAGTLDNIFNQIGIQSNKPTLEIASNQIRNQFKTESDSQQLLSQQKELFTSISANTSSLDRLINLASNDGLIVRFKDSSDAPSPSAIGGAPTVIKSAIIQPTPIASTNKTITIDKSTVLGPNQKVRDIAPKPERVRTLIDAEGKPIELPPEPPQSSAPSRASLITNQASKSSFGGLFNGLLEILKSNKNVENLKLFTPQALTSLNVVDNRSLKNDTLFREEQTQVVESSILSRIRQGGKVEQSDLNNIFISSTQTRDRDFDKSALEFAKRISDDRLQIELKILESTRDIGEARLANNYLIEAERKILAQLSDEQITLLEATRKRKVEEEKLNSILTKQLFRTGSKSGAELNAQLNREADAKIEGGEFSIKDAGNLFASELTAYNTRDFYKDVKDGAVDTARTIKSEFSSAFKDFATGSKSAGEAFRDFGLGVLNRISDITANISTDLLFSAIGSGIGTLTGGGGSSLTNLLSTANRKNSGGLIKRYGKGGKVTGGSGVKDDVPALLTEGEFVIKRTSVEDLGEDFLNDLNKGALPYGVGNAPAKVKTPTLDVGAAAVTRTDDSRPNSFSTILKNSFALNDAKRPTGGYFNVSSQLSSLGQTDESNPANRAKFAREEELVRYLQDRKDYDINRRRVLRNFERGQRQALTAAYIQAGLTIAASGLQYNSNRPDSSQSYGPYESGYRSGQNSNFGTNPSYGPYRGGYEYGRFSDNFSIPRYARGGHVFGGDSYTDKIPSLLTGGEFVVNKNSVDKYGVDFLNQLNSGSITKRDIPKYAEGGLVVGGRQSYGSNVGGYEDALAKMAESIKQLSESINSRSPVDKTKKAEGNLNNESNNEINNNINITVNVTKEGTASSSTQEGSSTSSDKEKEEARKLAELIRQSTLKIIVEQKRNGGLLAVNN